MALPQGQTYTVEDIYNLPEGQRAELIDGQIYYQAAPNRRHQDISVELTTIIKNHIKKHQGRCKVYPAPFAVYLNSDETEYFEPDISVICNPDLLKDKGCYGPPDFIIEITSPSTASRDYLLKSTRYQASGVKEYWIVNPSKETITIYNFTEDEFTPRLHTFKDKVKVNVFENLVIDFNELDI